MVTVVGLVTLADFGDDSSVNRVSVSAHHEAVLDDSRRLLLLDDRGWSSSGTWAQISATEG